MKGLIEACEVGTPIYRNFLYQMLVKSRAALEKILTFEQGLQLYELAEAVFPENDRAIAHHHGIWIRDNGRDPTRAYTQFEKALSMPDYPYAQIEEPRELVHTSMAAAVLAEARQSGIAAENALEQIQEHLRQAETPTFFNPHTTHVFGTLLSDLAREQFERGAPNIALGAIAEALGSVERTLQLVGARGQRQRRMAKAVEMLQALEQQLMEHIEDVEQVKKLAVESFDSSGSQSGFVVVARKLLADASKTNKGREYNRLKQYLDSVADQMRERHIDTSLDLLAVRIDMWIRWKLQAASGTIEWEPIRDDLCLALESHRYRDDVIKNYYYGVALYHCGEIAQANAVFGRLRRLVSSAYGKGVVRNFLVGKEGFAKRLQGTLRRSHGRLYVDCGELGTDMEVRGRPPPEAGDGATVHFYVGFSINGSSVEFQSPHPHDLVLP